MTPHEGQYIYLGSTEGQWPLAAFTAEAHAIDWLRVKDPAGRKRRLHRVRLTQVTEERLVQQPDYLEEVPE